MSIEFQTVGQLRALLADLPAGLPIMCQVVATNGQAWNLVGQFEGKCLGNFAVLQMKHEDLSNLQWPAQETPAEDAGARRERLGLCLAETVDGRDMKRCAAFSECICGGPSGNR